MMTDRRLRKIRSLIQTGKDAYFAWKVDIARAFFARAIQLWDPSEPDGEFHFWEAPYAGRDEHVAHSLRTLGTLAAAAGETALASECFTSAAILPQRSGEHDES